MMMYRRACFIEETDHYNFFLFTKWCLRKYYLILCPISFSQLQEYFKCDITGTMINKATFQKPVSEKILVITIILTRHKRDFL